MQTLHHGTYNAELALHRGLCLTDDWSAARAYADQYRDVDGDTPTVHTLELDLTGLAVVELEQDWDSQPETADEDAARYADAGTDAHPGVDVLVYQDFALSQHEQMTTYRLLTDRALAAVRITATDQI